ncbi:hypothetical protein QBC40DRAFT_68739 [Triangularia verruculosa]|uniref:Uncharacterized protein n=1 Tax=Triangularia verruculosa TaxID=2587418 RepID=A0AAN6XMP4_9PEZI|nr:hypothetical protein QBC40DRAFT_68739 [Triangularia verruculosa]
MSYTCPRWLDDHCRRSDASLYNGWYSNDGATEMSAEPTHPADTTDPTDYSGDPITPDHQYEYISGDDIHTPKDLDTTYPSKQHLPYPNDGNLSDGMMDEMAYHFMTGGRQDEDCAGMTESVEALPSTSPPQYVTQNPTSEFDQYSAASSNHEVACVAHHWSYVGATVDAAHMAVQEQQGYGYERPPLRRHINVLMRDCATGADTFRDFRRPYPGHIAESDLYGLDQRVVVDDAEDWEMVQPPL